MLVIRCSPLVKAESVLQSLAVFGPALGAVNRSSYLFGVPSVGGTLLNREAPLTSVRTDCTSAPLRYSPTVQPCSSGSPGSAILLKFASSHAVPFKLPEPGTPPISIETLALAVCGGLFHVTTAVFVSVVPVASPEAICSRKRTSMDCPCCNSPYTAE